MKNWVNGILVGAFITPTEARNAFLRYHWFPVTYPLFVTAQPEEDVIRCVTLYFT